jgi:hypothetical protein
LKNKTSQNGKYLEIIPNQQYQVGNLSWYATCTQDIKSIRIINPAPAIQKKSKDG